MSRLRLVVFALTCAFALPAAAQHRPASLPNAHGVDANRAAETMIRDDAAADAARRSRVERTTDEAEPAFVPDRVGRVQIEEVQIREDGSTEPLNADDDDGR
ncbi:hypothetical protein [Arenimonas composti]|uniref:Uncharacterized protein n=1 Tax=Arenimonas composti TR7-09 = DSM 18010 TaxID=1121013 RepID=A0A091B919_9GAMM|nr:hypothetical protein [Arenimonas composti]KFN49158.1 hypothetical protein P873_11935 [Arenimonas composti TR7-09 = DSM 18010]